MKNSKTVLHSWSVCAAVGGMFGSENTCKLARKEFERTREPERSRDA